jgi:phosphoglucosamine mutase
LNDARIFGTDGIRGRAGEGWLAPDAVSALGRAVAEVHGADARAAASERGGRPRALLGHDGRRSGPELVRALARGLASAGYEPVTVGLITTPGLALLGRTEGFELAIMVSASHNPAQDNGIKIFGAGGDKLADEEEDAIEAHLRAHPEAAPDGPAPASAPDLEELYLKHLTRSVPGLKLDGMTIVLDCANGGGSRVAPRALGRLGAQVIAIGAEPDGDNINDDCGATHPATLQGEVLRQSADLGISLDGDGDRCILVDGRGNIVHGDGILTLLGRWLAGREALPGGKIVATVMSNRGLHRALRDVGVGVATVGVGDRRVVERLRADGIALGGEQSGHVVFGADNHYIGDGVYTALRVLEAVRDTGSSLEELASPYQPLPQVLINVPVHEKPSLAELPDVATLVREIEEELGEDGRVLLRYSGTEPLARVMVEGPDGESIQRQAQSIAGVIAKAIG